MAEAVRSQVKRLNTSSSFFKQQAVVGLFHIIRQSIRVLQKDVVQDAVAACLASRSEVGAYDMHSQLRMFLHLRPGHQSTFPSSLLQVAVEEAVAQLEQLVHSKIGLDVKDAQALLIDAITATGQSPSLHPPSAVLSTSCTPSAHVASILRYTCHDQHRAQADQLSLLIRLMISQRGLLTSHAAPQARQVPSRPWRRASQTSLSAVSLQVCSTLLHSCF